MSEEHDIELRNHIPEIQERCGDYMAGLIAELIADYEACGDALDMLDQERARLSEQIDALTKRAESAESDMAALDQEIIELKAVIDERGGVFKKS